MFDFQHILTPIAVVRRQRPGQLGHAIEYRTLHLFGVRIAYWTC